MKKQSFSNYDLQVDLARKYFLEHDQQLLIRKYRLSADVDWLYLSYLHSQFRISRKSGQVDEYSENGWTECRNYNTVMTIYDLLCHHKGDRLPVLSDRWCPVGNFIITGVQNTGTFTKEYAAFFQAHLDRLPQACKALGGILQDSMAGADLTCLFPVTDYFSVLFRFWAADDEFPPTLSLLWGENSMEFLHFETTFYLQGDLLERLKKKLQ